MLTPEFLEEIPNGMSGLMLQFENHTLIEIARRLKANEGIFTSSMIYRLNRLNELNSFNTDYKKRLQKLLKMSDAEIDKIFEQAASNSYGYDKALFEAKGIVYTPFEQNKQLQQLAYSVAEQTKREFKNLTQTTATKMLDPISHNPVPVPKFFEQTLDSTAYRVASGVQSYDAAIREAVINMTQGILQPDGSRIGGGILNIIYDKNGKMIRRSIESVVRATILTSVSQLADKITWDNIRMLGAEHVIVSKHDGARKGEGFRGHVNWQGRVFALNGFNPGNILKEQTGQTDTQPRSEFIKSSLTDEEKYAINSYTSWSSYQINENIRNEIPLTTEEQSIIKGLDAAMEKLPKYVGKVNRSMIVRREYIYQIAQQALTGKLEFPAYTSATTLTDYHESPNVLMSIKSKTGRDLRSINADEQEILFPRGSSFKVLNVDYDNGVLKIEMEEL